MRALALALSGRARWRRQPAFRGRLRRAFSTKDSAPGPGTEKAPRLQREDTLPFPNGFRVGGARCECNIH